jgi:hypothetical protein
VPDAERVKLEPVRRLLRECTRPGAARRIVKPQGLPLAQNKYLKPLLRIGQCRVAVLSAIGPATAPTVIDVYPNPGRKTTVMSGRNIPVIGRVANRVVTAGMREGVGRSRLAPPDLVANWHYNLPGTGFTRPADHLPPRAEYNALRPGGANWHYFRLIYRMQMHKLSSSFMSGWHFGRA